MTSFVVLPLLTFHGVFLYDRNPSLIGRKEWVKLRKTGENGAEIVGREMKGIGVKENS